MEWPSWDKPIMWLANLISGCILISISHTCMLASFPGLLPRPPSQASFMKDSRFEKLGEAWE